MPKLYSAELLGEPTPVSNDGIETKEKKPRTEKQIEAAEKRKAANAAKKAELALAKELEAALEAERIKTETEKGIKEAEKKKIQAEKRKAARDAKKAASGLVEKVQEITPQTSTDGSIATDGDVGTPSTVEVPKGKKRARKETVPKEPKPTDTEPPQWFKKYIAGVKKEENAVKKVKLPKKQVDEEIEEVSHKAWGDGLVRDRLRNEVDGHMGRMYGMIFNHRRMI